MLFSVNSNLFLLPFYHPFFVSVAPHLLPFLFSHIYSLPIFWIPFWVLNHSINVTYLEIEVLFLTPYFF